MFFPYRTKAQRAEVTREERVFFPVERTGRASAAAAGPQRPMVTSRPALFRAEQAQAETQTQTTCTLIVQVVHLIVRIVRGVRTHSFKSSRAASSLAFRCCMGSYPCIVSSRHSARYAARSLATIPLMAHRFTTIQPPRILDALARCARNALRASFC